MRSRYRPCVLALALLAGPPAHAAIIGTCTIVVNQAGTMTTGTAINILGSRQPGGVSASVGVNASSLLCSLLNLLDCYSFSAIAPAAFLSAPAGGDANVGFASAFRIDGGAEFPGGMPRRIVNGNHTMLVDLTATKTSGVFPAGTYQAQVVARCE